MKVRRSKRKKQNRKWLAAAGIFFCFVVSIGQFRGKDITLAAAIVDEVKRGVYQSAVKNYMPGFYYGMSGQKTGMTAWEFVSEKLLKIIPVYGYITSQKTYETPAESELSYEAILKREALDENYIDDETGEVMLAAYYENEEELLSQAQSENVKTREENQKAGVENQEEADEEGEQKEEPPVEEPQAGQGEETLAVTQDMIGDFPLQMTPLVNYPREKLNDFDYLIQNFYTVDRTTTINSSQLKAGELLAKDLKLKGTNEQPQILIYHTHSQEMYIDSTPEDLMTGVMGCGEYLTQILTEKYGLNVLHHMGQYDVEKRDYAYSNAAPALETLLAQNPSIEVVIDLHRDAVPEDVHMVRNVQGIDMAPVMFFNGLSRLADKGDIEYLKNPYIEDNLAFSLQMKLAASEYYPELTRPVYLKGYRYNMHYCPKTLLIELGAQTNTFGEARNAMAPLADLLHKVLCE